MQKKEEDTWYSRDKPLPGTLISAAFIRLYQTLLSAREESQSPPKPKISNSQIERQSLKKWPSAIKTCCVASLRCKDYEELLKF